MQSLEILIYLTTLISRTAILLRHFGCETENILTSFKNLHTVAV